MRLFPPLLHWERMLSAIKVISQASTNATLVKSASGRVYNAQLFNTAASARFVKLYDKTSAPTVGTDIPKLTWMVPAGGGAVIEAQNGISFAQGIALAITGAIADSDATAVALNDVVANLQYT